MVFQADEIPQVTCNQIFPFLGMFHVEHWPCRTSFSSWVMALDVPEKS
jgi:hypothetical protein